MPERVAVWIATLAFVGFAVAIPVLVVTGGAAPTPYPSVPAGSHFVDVAPAGSTPSYADGYNSAVNFHLMKGQCLDTLALPRLIGENPSEFEQGCLASAK